MIGLTHKQRDCLSFIRAYMAEHGICPSYREMREALALKSTSGSARLVLALEERGHIRRLPGRGRAIEIVEHNPLADVSTSAIVKELVRRRDMTAGSIVSAINA
jgi:SOS-response transcriptional repressor LexA